MKTIPSLSSLRALAGGEITIEGAVHRIRAMGSFAFLLLRTSHDVFQCVWSPEWCDQDISSLTPECGVRAVGRVVEDARSRAGAEIRITGWTELSRPAEALPVDIRGATLGVSLETLLDMRPLTLRHPGQRAVFRVVHALAAGFRGFLDGQGFTEIHTPKIVSEGAEGGAGLFRLGYFGRTACLAQSPQFYKQIAAAAFGRVYEVGPVFRAEPHDSARHLNEFTGLDLEMAWLTGEERLDELIDCEIEVLESMLAHLRAACPEECASLGLDLPERLGAVRTTFAEAKAIAARTVSGAGPDDLNPAEERAIGRHFKEERGTDWVFVTRYPSAARPFYAMDDPEDPALTLSYDLLYRGAEITTGGLRIHDYAMQVEKLKSRGLDPADFSSWLMLHRYGAPPHGGFGLGLERLTMQLCGLDNIRRASLFPRDTVRLTP